MAQAASRHSAIRNVDKTGIFELVAEAIADPGGAVGQFC